MTNIEEKTKAFTRLLKIMDELRTQCPWDKKQTLESLRTLTIEEVYELAESIQSKDMQSLKKELGDVLLHIVFYSKIASETNDFDITGVINSLCEKLIFRHPHIYGDVHVQNEREVADNWEKLKLKEKGNKRVLGGMPKGLPAMIKAHRLQDKARGVGFDWTERRQVWDKVNEELNELKAEIETMNQDKMEEEFGDLMFSLINAARLYDINPENALERTNRKFLKRFNHLEDQTIRQGKSLKEMTLEEMDVFWEEAKNLE